MVNVALTSLIPKGIRLRKGKKSDSFLVQTRKLVRDADGKEHQVKDARTVRINANASTPDAEYVEKFKVALDEAIAEKNLAKKHIAIHGLDSTTIKQRAVGTLGEVYNLVFEKRWKGTPQERNMHIFASDLFAYFPKSITMADMQTHEHYDNFIEFMEKRISERKMNNRGTYKTTTTNRRLGVIRCCIAYAIEHGLLHKVKVLNNDPKEENNYGWKNLKVAKVKDKNTLTKADEAEVIAKAKELGDDEFADAYAWLIDVGMRYESEFQTFTIKDINWKKKTICFYRGKIGDWSVNLPLSKRAWSIALRYKDVALTRTSQRMFSLSKHKIEAMFRKYKELCDIEDHTPYITRHTFGTRLGERGVIPKIIAKMMGHSCTETAQKYYIKATDKGMERAVKLAELSDEQFDSFLDNQNDLIGHNSKGLI